MIIVNDRTITIPPEERCIGVVGDNLVEMRQFVITETKLFNFDFKLDIKNGQYLGVVDLEKTIESDRVILTWIIKEQDIPCKGKLYIWLRAFNRIGEEKWNSFPNFDLIVERNSGATDYFPSPLPSEFEQMEQRVTAIKNDVVEKGEEILQIKTDAEQIAQSVRDDADNGLFKGEKGEQGIQGEQGIPGINTNVSDVRVVSELPTTEEPNVLYIVV